MSEQLTLSQIKDRYPDAWELVSRQHSENVRASVTDIQRAYSLSFFNATLLFLASDGKGARSGYVFSAEYARIAREIRSVLPEELHMYLHTIIAGLLQQ